MHEIAVCPGTPSDVVRLAPVVAALRRRGQPVAEAARRTAARDGLLDRPRRAGARRVLVVAHRSRSDGRRGVGWTVARLAERADVEVVLASASSPAERAALAVHDNVVVRGRLGWDALVAEIAASHLVLTDDGLVEEAAPALGVPVLAMSEAGAAVEDGGADPVRLLQLAERLLDDESLHRRMATAAQHAADGRAADRSAARLAADLGAAAHADLLAA